MSQKDQFHPVLLAILYRLSYILEILETLDFFLNNLKSSKDLEPSYWMEKKQNKHNAELQRADPGAKVTV